MGVVDGYEAEYFNDGLVLSGTPSVYSLAAVFMTAQGAQSYIQLLEQTVPADWTPVSSPTLGDQTIAYRAVFEEEGFRFIAYIIVFRKGNIVAVTQTLAWSPVASFDVTLSFAEIVLAKINGQIAVDVRAIGGKGLDQVLSEPDHADRTVAQGRAPV